MTPTPKDRSCGLNGAVAAVLNGERAAAGITFEQLGADVGLSKRTVLRLLSTMERDIDVDVLAAMAARFSMTPVEVIEAAQKRMERAERTDDLATKRAARKSPSPAIQKKAARKDKGPDA